MVGAGDRSHCGAGGDVPARHVLSLCPTAPQDGLEPEPQKGHVTQREPTPTGS